MGPTALACGPDPRRRNRHRHASASRASHPSEAGPGRCCCWGLTGCRTPVALICISLVGLGLSRSLCRRRSSAAAARFNWGAPRHQPLCDNTQTGYQAAPITTSIKCNFAFDAVPIGESNDHTTCTPIDAGYLRSSPDFDRGLQQPQVPATADVAVSKAAVDNAAGAGGTQFAPMEMAAARELARANKAMADKDYKLAVDLAAQAQADAKLAQGKANSAKAQAAGVLHRCLQDDIKVLRSELERTNK